MAPLVVCEVLGCYRADVLEVSEFKSVGDVLFEVLAAILLEI